jgi:hypothetical protein
VKCSLAPSLGYTIDGAGSFSWTGSTKLTPEDLLTDRPIGAGLPRRKLVAEWLRQNLLDGRRSQYNIEAAAHREGNSTHRKLSRHCGESCPRVLRLASVTGVQLKLLR